MRILHLATASDWDYARASGSYTTSTRGVTLEQQGFVHASTARQLSAVAERFYPDVTEPLVLLVLDVDALISLGSPVVWEVPPGSDAEYPHVYGPVPVDAVVAVRPAAFSHGRFQPPDLTGLDVA